MSLSVAIATYNEEENIARCLQSVKNLTDEIILFDGSSTDKTAEIAKALKAKVYIVPNEEMFHKNKQLAIDKCTGDWIFQLDADEEVSPPLIEEITKIINPQSFYYQPKINGYWIPRKNFFLGKYLTKGGQYPDYTLRLYKRGKGKLPCRSVHEQAEVDGKIGYLKNPLLHHAYPDFSHYLEHFNLYTSLLSKEFEEVRLPLTWQSFLIYIVLYPKWWFLKTFFRHKGFEDGFAGFVFSLFSALRFPAAYIKYWERIHYPKKIS